MTARIAGILSVAAGVGLLAAGCASLTEIPIETSIQPKLDVSAFTRVLVAGFVAGGTDDVDVNLETVRLFRSQLRTKSGLRVIDADPMPLVQLAKERIGAGGAPPAATEGGGAVDRGRDEKAPGEIKSESDLEAYEPLFASADFWKRIGQEYQDPLIVTGTVLLAPRSSSSLVQRDEETYDAVGRRQVVPVRTYVERNGFVLTQKVIFIDGRSGATVHTETFREERLYNRSQNMPALSTYFELMDEIVPKFLSALSAQRVRGTRVLLQ